MKFKHMLFVLTVTTSIIFVLFNIIWLNFKSIKITNIIAPIPSIDIITFFSLIVKYFHKTLISFKLLSDSI